jgi:hypothetical protein
MNGVQAPAWCRWRRGTSAVLVVAPHGGRREPVPPVPGGTHNTGRGRKVNDLHTADLAEELADTLDAALIVNPALDRNRLDLNRISQVTARAGWFLALIEALVDEILAQHPHAELLFVHGWNVIQPKCDVGIGQSLADANGSYACAEALTVSPGYATGRLDGFRTACAAAGIATTYGVRYPARHPNNLLQLFRPGAGCPQMPLRLAAWTASRRIEAVQLELGVPVRWPGAYRRGFLRAALAAFNGAPAHDRGTRDRSPLTAPASARLERQHDEPVSQSASLQLYDPRAAIALTARVDRTGAQAAGRLLVFLGRERLALFIGEELQRGRQLSEGPHFTTTPHGFRMRFDGAALAGDDGGLYWDLEQAFAASNLCAVKADLSFRRQLAGDYGVAEGWIDVDGARHGIRAQAFARHAVLSGSPGVWSSQLTLSAAFGPQRALRVRHEFPGSGALRELTLSGEVSEPLPPPLTIRFDGDGYTPTRIVIGNDTLVCEPHTRMAITRPLPPHRQGRVTFGAARFIRAGGEEGFGFYEYARALV